MTTVEPIRNVEDIRKVERILAKQSQRNLLFFTIGTNCGLRISDILRLNVGDVRGKTHIQIIEKKTGKFKKFPINSKLKPMFEEYTKGYLSALGDSVTKCEKDNLPFGAILMTFECGMRFLADYLDGDVYFRTHREGHNLDRARTQFKLVSDMEKLLPKMQEIVNKL